MSVGASGPTIPAAAAAAMRSLLGLAALQYSAVIGLRVTVALSAVAAGLSPASIGLLLATFALVPMLLAVRGGQLVDRIGVRRPMQMGCALAAAGAVACAAWPHPAVLAVAAGAIGLGGMAFHLGMQHAAGEIGGAERRHANFNLLTMSFSVSGLIGPPMAGMVIDLASHRHAFAVCAALLMGSWIGLRRFDFARHLPSEGDSRSLPVSTSPDAAAPDADEPRAPGTSPFDLLGSPRLRRLLIASLLASASWDVYQFVLPLHAPTLGLSAASVGFAIAAFSAGSLSVRLVLPSLVSRMRPARWMQVALTVCVLAYAAAPFASNLLVLVALSFLVGTGPGIAQPLLMSALHTASPPGRAGEAAGLRMTLLSAMQLGVPIGLGLVAGVLGTSALFWLYAGLAAAIGTSLARAERR
jgi:MFS family permease